MGKKYTLYVDESGDSGTQKIRNKKSGGASQFMVLGGVLIADGDKEDLALSLNQICTELACQQLHCQKINHHKQVYAARYAGMLDFECFGVISDKNTLEGYNKIKDQEAFRYHHKCVQYLLEQLCKYLKQKQIYPLDVNVVFEETNSLRLPKLQNFINLCIENPKTQHSRILNGLNTDAFSVSKKSNEPLLQYADLVANSLYQCVNKSSSNYQIPETRYINELRTKFWGNPKDGLINGFGIKPIHDLNSLSLDADVKAFFQKLKNT